MVVSLAKLKGYRFRRSVRLWFGTRLGRTLGARERDPYGLVARWLPLRYVLPVSRKTDREGGKFRPRATLAAPQETAPGW